MTLSGTLEINKEKYILKRKNRFLNQFHTRDYSESLVWISITSHNQAGKV